MEQDLDLILSFVLIDVPDGAIQNDLNSISDVQKETYVLNNIQIQLMRKFALHF